MKTNEERKKNSMIVCLFGLNQTHERPTDEIVPDPKNFGVINFMFLLLFSMILYKKGCWILHHLAAY